MRIARYESAGIVSYGVVDPRGETVTPASGSPFGELTLEGEPVDLSSVRLLAPVVPTKVVCWGNNWPGVTAEDRPKDQAASVWLVPPTAVNDPGGLVVHPRQLSQDSDVGIVHEVELAVVIGRRCYEIRADQARDFIFGYTIANDISVVGVPDHFGGRWAGVVLRKGRDGYLPLGPWIETELDPADAVCSMSIDGVELFRRSTSDMISSADELVAEVAAVITLLPGDVVIMGTPNFGRVAIGQEMAATIEGIGTLRNAVVAPS